MYPFGLFINSFFYDYNMPMQNRVKIIRKSLKLSQEKFSELLGISRVQIARLETGARNLSMENAALYAQIISDQTDLTITPIEFFYDSDEISKNTSADPSEQELLHAYRGMSDHDKAKYLQMGYVFSQKDAKDIALPAKEADNGNDDQND